MKKAASIAFGLALLHVGLAQTVPAESWKELSVSGAAPGKRHHHAAAYDPVGNAMFIRGGSAGNKEFWKLTLGEKKTWTKLPFELQRIGQSMTYVPDEKAIYIIGGAYPKTNETWKIKLGATRRLVQVSPAGPLPRSLYTHTAIYTPKENAIIVYGDKSHRNETWKLTLGDKPRWSEIKASGQPHDGGHGATAVYDPADNSMVVIGGTGDNGSTNQVSKLMLGSKPAWKQLEVQGTPPSARRYHNSAMCPDGSVLTIGTDNKNDVWRLTLGDSPRWTELKPSGDTLPARYGHTTIYHPPSHSLIIFGGCETAGRNRRNDLWQLSGLPVRNTQDKWPAAAEKLPAFPGAEGFGATAVGGRGGRVIEVTNLNDAGRGSFRAACDAEGPRTVVFGTGGTIYLKKRIELRHPNITIAGQTAPGGGICFSIAPKTADGGPLKVMTSEVVIRHVRFRPGPPERAEFGENVDGLTIANRNGSIRNVIIDHCSFSWSTDELFNTWYDVKDVTVQWCLFSEALSKSKHNKGNHSKGPLLGSIAGDRQSYHHNLMVHNVGRNPMIKLNGLADVVNNVAHVPRVVAMSISDEYAPARANFVGNFVTAPNGDGIVHGCIFLPTGKGFAVYAQGNIGPHLKDVDGKQSRWFRNIKGEFFAIKRHPAPKVTTHTAKEARQLVLKHAGATQPTRDSVDTRIVGEVKAGRTRIVDHPKDVGGWPKLSKGTPLLDGDHDGMPDAWERAHRLNPNDSADGLVIAANGYTNLENYLNEMAGDQVP